MTPFAFISLTNPFMLGGLVLLAFPVAAHLLNRYARRQIVFPSLQLLRAAVANESQLMKLRRWLLLLLRCLMVAALVAAFARPVWLRSKAAAADSSRENAVVIVLDVSASMQYQRNGVALMEVAKGAARRVLEQLRSGQDVADVVIAAAQPVAVFDRLSPNLGALQSEVNSQQATFEHADGFAACRLAGRLLAKHSGPKRLILISDLQQTNWQLLLDPSQLRALIPAGTEIVTVDLDRSQAENISLQLPRSFPSQPLAGQPVELIVQVHNGTSVEKQVRVRALVDEGPLSPQLVALAAGERRDVAFVTELDELRAHAVVFRIDPDFLRCDNESFLVARTVERLNVTLVTDDDPQRPGSGAYYLTRALAPFRDDSNRYTIRSVAGRELTAEDLVGATAVLVEYLGQLTPQTARLLHEYLQQGGGLVVFSGEGGVRRNLLMLDQQEDNGLLPWLPGPRADLSERAGAFISGGKWRSPLLRDFDQASQIALGKIRFSTIWQALEVRPDAEVLLSFDDGTPALASRPIGRGQLILANFSPGSESSDLGKYGAFVALTQMLVKNLRSQDGSAAADYVGQPQLQNVRTSEPAANLQLFDPTGSEVRANIAVGPESVVVQLARPQVPGIYRVKSGAKSIDALAVNLNPDESDLTSIPPARLDQRLAGAMGAGQVYSHADWDSALDLEGRPLWGWLMVLAMVCAATELFFLGYWRR